jgi:type I restriction enzyme S subunit
MTFSVREVSLGEVCEIKQGRYLAPNQMEPIPTNECIVPVIGGNGVLGYTDQSTFPFPVPLVTCRGSKCGLMQWAEPPTWISNNAMAVYFKENQGDNFFLHQYLLNSSFDDVATGSAQPQITVTNLSLKQILLPDLQTQKKISLIMKNIEAKIATNNALSKTLEDIAQAIFKSWFIDFDPVKAKMAGEKPAGMDAATAALFPDTMEESELGLIPKGWEHKKVEEILKRITVKGLPKSTVLLNLGRTLVLEQGDSVIAGFIDDAADVEASMESPAFVFGDHTCRMRLSTMPFSIFPNTIVLTSELINTYWAFGATWGLQKFETYRRHWMELAYKVLIVPNTEIANVYGERVKPLFEIIDSLTVQNRVLSALRDDLLPRLISGELQIPEEMLAS